jgi:hypothetical protein
VQPVLGQACQSARLCVLPLNHRAQHRRAVLQQPNLQRLGRARTGTLLGAAGPVGPYSVAQMCAASACMLWMTADCDQRMGKCFAVVQFNFCAERLRATWQAYCTDSCATWRCRVAYREHSTWHYRHYATCHVARQALDNILCAINLILWIAIVVLFLWIMLEDKFRSATAVRSARSFEYICCFVALFGNGTQAWPKRKRSGPSADFGRSPWD